MTFGGTQDGVGGLFLVARATVHRSTVSDQQPHMPEDEFDIEIWEKMPNRRHVLVMDRPLLEDFVKQARMALEDQG